MTDYVVIDTMVYHRDLEPREKEEGDRDKNDLARKVISEWWRCCHTAIVSRVIKNEVLSKGFYPQFENLILPASEDRPPKLNQKNTVDDGDIREFQREVGWAHEVKNDEHLFLAAKWFAERREETVYVVSDDWPVVRTRAKALGISPQIKVCSMEEYLAETEDLPSRREDRLLHHRDL